MNHTEKVALVPQSMIDKFLTTQTQNSSIHEFQTLDDDMKSILFNSNLPPDVKLNKYNEVLQRFMDKKKTLESTEHPIKIKSDVTNNKIKDVVQDVKDNEKLDKDFIITAMPKPQQKKVTGLLQLLNKKPNFTWDQFGQIKIDNRLLPKTNIIDLLNFYSRPQNFKREQYPGGWDVFGKFLSDNNIPKIYLSNKEALKHIIGSSESQQINPNYTPSTEEFQKKRTSKHRSSDNKITFTSPTKVGKQSTKKLKTNRKLTWDEY